MFGYGIYRKTRDASWNALIDNQVTSLPVDVTAIAMNNGVKVFKNSTAKMLTGREMGILLTTARNG